jgi:hypothetical protein
LDNSGLDIPVYWPGRELRGTGPYDAILSWVEDRRHPGGVVEGPGMLITLTYSGPGGIFRLDYWPPGKWEEFKQRAGPTFAWATCSDRRVLAALGAEIVILRGFEPDGRTLPPPEIYGATPAPLPDPFPAGCPQRDYDLFMAEVRFPDATVTINAPYTACCHVGVEFGSYDSEAGVETIARSLRLRQPGE